MSSPNNNTYAGPMNNPSGTIILQPVVEFPQKDLSAIRFFSYSSIVLGIASQAIQFAAFVVGDGQFTNYNYGILAGIFYPVAGRLGLLAAARRTPLILKIAIVMSAISVISSVIAAIFTALIATSNADCYYYYYYSCSTYVDLQWSLMAISILSFFSVTILFSLTCKAKYCSNNPNGIVFIPTQQQPIHVPSSSFAPRGQTVTFYPQATQQVQPTTQHQVNPELPTSQPMNNSYPNSELQGADIGNPPPYQYSNEAFVPNETREQA